MRSLITGTIGKVEAFYEEGNNSRYLLSTIDGEKFTPKANNLEPYFPKEGEYCYCEMNWADKWLFISSKKKGILSHMTAFCPKDDFIDYNNQITDDENIKDLRPATSEEKALLDSELAKRGLIFDGKEIVNNDTPKVGDFCIFWDENKGTAFCAILERMINAPIYKYGTRDGLAAYIHCVKFESEEQFRKIKEGKI